MKKIIKRDQEWKKQLSNDEFLVVKYLDILKNTIKWKSKRNLSVNSAAW